MSFYFSSLSEGDTWRPVLEMNSAAFCRVFRLVVMTCLPLGRLVSGDTLAEVEIPGGERKGHYP